MAFSEKTGEVPELSITVALGYGPMWYERDWWSESSHAYDYLGHEGRPYSELPKTTLTATLDETLASVYDRAECGAALGENAKFCAACGTKVTPSTATPDAPASAGGKELPSPTPESSGAQPPYLPPPLPPKPAASSGAPAGPYSPPPQAGAGSGWTPPPGGLRGAWHGYRTGLPRWVQWTLPIVFVLVISGLVTSQSNKKSPAKAISSTPTTNASASIPTAPATTTPTVAKPSIPKSEQEARVYISNHGPDINRVQAEVLTVELAIGTAVKSSTQANINQLAQQAQTAHDSIDNIRDDFATASSDPGELGNAELNAFSGANDLKNAMGALVAYTGDPNAATLAQFTTQFRNAKAEWNSGMRVIYRDARRRHPPTV